MKDSAMEQGAWDTTELPSDSAEPVRRGSGVPRLVIKEMVMRNFKSYAGEQRVGPFHKSFSAVVGPNGSGKSNVIDAMLFVFGKRAKQMRLSKVSELIHNSTNHQNLDSAGVSVYFQEITDQDDGTYEAVPQSDFSITRVALRDNSSKYYINDRTSNFTEVTKKLKGKGVDLDNNRFLILQGEVEQISLMKPRAQGPHDEGFLEYLEDIIGTNKYVEKIDQSRKQLEELNEQRSGVVQMVKLAEKERDSLENVKNEAEDYMLKELSHLRWQEKASTLAHEETSICITEVESNLAALEENLKNERDKIQGSNGSLKELETLHNKYSKRQEELNNALRKCKEEFKEFERQDVKHREDLKHLKQKLNKIDEKVDKDSSKLDSLLKEGEGLTQLIPKLESDVPRFQGILSEEEKKLEELLEISKVETEKYRLEIGKVRDELEPWERKLIEHKGKLEVACNESKLLNQKHERARAAYEDAQNQKKNTQENAKKKRGEVERVRNELEKCRREAAEMRKLESELIAEQEALIPAEKAVRQKLSELLSVMESEKSQGCVLKAIMQAKESKEIEGIHGRMGDLGAIDAIYDVAISTACHGLDYIVVETTESAQACVELLRRRKLGVATFMILEKQAHYQQKLKEKVKTPEGAPRLFDLVRVQDPRMKLAFYAAVGNTVVAKDLDQAARIAYGRDAEFRRVVTLEGALFEKSGTMTGGGGRPRGGKMGTSIKPVTVSAESVAAAEAEVSRTSEALIGVRRRINDAVESYRSSEKVSGRLEIELAKTESEIESMSKGLTDLENQLDSLKVSSQPKNDEVHRLKELKKLISFEEGEISRLTGGSKELTEKASLLQRKIENAGGDALKSQKAKVVKIQSDIDRTNADINKQKVKSETGKKTIKKLSRTIEEAREEREQMVEEREKLLCTFKEIEERALAVQQNYSKTQELINDHGQVLENAVSEYNKLKKTVNDLRAAEVDADYKLKDMKKTQKELNAKAESLIQRTSELQAAAAKQTDQINRDMVDPVKLAAVAAPPASCDLQTALSTVAVLEARLKEMNPNLDSIVEYRRKLEVYNERVEELNGVTQRRDDVKREHDELRKRRLDEFMGGFNTISLKLKEMYQMITLGGDAELELVDSLDPFAEGVVFSVRPPKKSWKNIANLSGGEKTLSSLALVFALHHYKPTPLYVMDEIDAALDFKNVSIVGHYVKDRTRDAQFIIISLRNNMFELADRLVGIYKTDNCTKSITINPSSFAICEKAA